MATIAPMDEAKLSEQVRDSLVESELRSRYALACAFARGGTVLDAGSVESAGSELLAAAGTLTRGRPDDDDNSLGNRDLVVCFDGLERERDPAALIERLAGAAKPDTGVVMVSVPADASGFGPERLVAELAQRFANVTTLRQHNWVASALLGDDEFVSGDAARQVVAEVRKTGAAQAGDELYVLAIASNAPLPEASNMVMLSRGAEVREWMTRVDDAESQLAAARSEAESLRDELEAVREADRVRIEDLQDRLAWVEENELYLRQTAERFAFVAFVLRVWARMFRLQRRARQKLR